MTSSQAPISDPTDICARLSPDVTAAPQSPAAPGAPSRPTDRVERVSLGLEAYQAELLSLVSPSSGRETVALDDALGRVLAQDVTSRSPNPAFANAAMDGYAVRFADAHAPVRLSVVADLAAGCGSDPVFGAGQCVRIMTGAPLPTCADTVVPVEHTDGGTDVVEVRVAPARRGAHVRAAGEDYPRGARVASSGEVLTPGRLGAVAAAGCVAVVVRPVPVVAVCATGDELVSDGSELARGQVHDANSHALAAALRRDGARVLRGAPLADAAAAVMAWLDEAASSADLIVVTGGASVGAYDVVRDVLREHGGGVFRWVRVRPGKPQGWARWRGTPVVALPGTPTSAALCYEVFVAPLVATLGGRLSAVPVTARAATSWAGRAGQSQLTPVTLATCDDGVLRATPTFRPGACSHPVAALAAADGIAVIPEDQPEVRTDDLLSVLTLR